MISRTSWSGETPDPASARPTMSASAASRSCRAETFTETDSAVPDHRPTWWQACSSTNTPMSLMRSLLSAASMNSSATQQAALRVLPAQQRLDPATGSRLVSSTTGWKCTRSSPPVSASRRRPTSPPGPSASAPTPWNSA